jgi:NitT/TauT family transport system substrate-binding protein
LVANVALQHSGARQRRPISELPDIVMATTSWPRQARPWRSRLYAAAKLRKLVLSSPREGLNMQNKNVTPALVLAACLAATPVAAEPIKIGVVAVNAFAPIYVAQERGYFAAEGVPAELIDFDAAAPVAVAAVSGAVDFGVAAVTAAFYNLAGRGELKMIAGAAHEAPGFQIQAFLASKKAYDEGLTTVHNLAGKKFGVTGQGAPPVYVVGGILAEKYHFDFKKVEILPLQTIPNINTALTGGKADFTSVSMTPGMMSLIDRGEVKQIAWTGDEAPWQFGIVFTGTKTADDRHDTVQRFLRAYRKGAKDYHDAVTGPDGKRKSGPATDAMIAILAKYTKQTPAEVKLGIPYLDPEGRVDVKDVLHQIAFYKTLGLVKEQVDGHAIMDQRYVVALPGS